MKQIEYSILWITVTICFFVQCINGFLETSRDGGTILSLRSSTLRMISERDEMRRATTPDQARFSSKRLRENRELLIPTRRTIDFQDGLTRSPTLAKRNIDDMTWSNSRNQLLSQNQFTFTYDNMKRSFDRGNEQNFRDITRRTRSSSTRREGQLSRRIAQREVIMRVLDNRDQDRRSQREDNRRLPDNRNSMDMERSYRNRLSANEDNRRTLQSRNIKLERNNRRSLDVDARENTILDSASSRRHTQGISRERNNSERQSNDEFTYRTERRDLERGPIMNRREQLISGPSSRRNFERDTPVRSQISLRVVNSERDTSERDTSRRSLNQRNSLSTSGRDAFREMRFRNRASERSLVRKDTGHTNSEDPTRDLGIRRDTFDHIRFQSNRLSIREKSRRNEPDNPRFIDEKSNIRENRISRLSSSEKIRQAQRSRNLPMRQALNKREFQENRNAQLPSLERSLDNRRSRDSADIRDARRTLNSLNIRERRDIRLQSAGRASDDRLSKDIFATQSPRRVRDNMSLLVNNNSRLQSPKWSRENRRPKDLSMREDMRRVVRDIELQENKNRRLTALDRSRDIRRSKNMYVRQDARRVLEKSDVEENRNIRLSSSERVQDNLRSTEIQGTRRMADMIRDSRTRSERLTVNERFSRNRLMKRDNREVSDFTNREANRRDIRRNEISYRSRNLIHDQRSSTTRLTESRLAANERKNTIQSEHRLSKRDTEYISLNNRERRVVLLSSKREDTRLPVRDIDNSRFERNIRDGAKSRSLDRRASEFSIRNIRDMGRNIPVISSEQERTIVREFDSRQVTKNVRDLGRSLFGNFETSMNQYDAQKIGKTQPSIYQVGEWVILGVLVMQMVISISPKTGFRLPLFNNGLKEKVF